MTTPVAEVHVKFERQPNDPAALYWILRAVVIHGVPPPAEAIVIVCAPALGVSVMLLPAVNT